MTIMSLLYQLLFFFTPLIFNTLNTEQFEIPKMYFIYGLTAIILLTHLIKVARGQSPFFRHTFLDIPLLLFLISQTVSTIFSIDIHTSFFGYYSRLNGGLLSLICYAILYWTLATNITDGLKQKLIATSLTSGFIVAAYGILQHLGIDKSYWRQDVVARVFSTLGQPNWLAAYLCILLPLSIDNALKSTKFSPIYHILYTTYFICLLFTKSKSGIIAAVISLGIYGMFYLLKNKSKNIVLPITVYGLLIILSLLIPNPVKDYFFPPHIPYTNPQSPTLNITPSEDIRKIVWKGAFDLWRQYPLFGTGPETFAYTYYWVRPTSHNLTSEWNFLYNKAHNEYLNYLATTGTFGFTSYLLLIIFITYYVLRVTNYDNKVMVFSSFLSILITNSAGFSVAVISLYFFLLPVLTLEPIGFIPPKKQSYSGLRITFYVLLFLFVESKVLFFYLADIAYSQAMNYDDSQKYLAALEQIKISYSYRPDEPNYLIKYADISSKLAVVTKSDVYVAPAIATATKATSISPFDINLWKQKSQVYYYLSAIDNRYYSNALSSMTTATRLAPTDAMAFYLLGNFYNSIKDIPNATINFEKAYQLKSNYDYATFALGKIYFDQKKYPEAKMYFEKTLQIAPANTKAKELINSIK